MTDKMVHQWSNFKLLHPDALLMFRMGDFYAFYGVDALAVEKIINREISYEDSGLIPELHFPHFNLDEFLPKIIRAGKRVAICDPIQ